MKIKDIKIGMKVVPHSKSIWAEQLEESVEWQKAQMVNQNFLYVRGRDSEIYRNPFVLCHENGEGVDGDYFLAKDFEPYEETLI